MAKAGLGLVCRRCGATFTRPGSLWRHRRERRCPGRAQAKVLDVIPSRSGVVHPGRESALAWPVQAEARIIPVRRESPLAEMLAGEVPPTWWEPQGDLGWRRQTWASYPADYRRRLLAERAGAAFTIRPPDASDKVILWSQYHLLKALATRLDAGIATERERAAFEAGLREYDAHYDRVRAQRKALPA